MKHNNGYLMRQQAYLDAKAKIYRDTAMQYTMDAALIAAHEVFGMGKGRAEAFYNEIKDTMLSIARLMDSDEKSNLRRNIEFTKAKVDRELQAIVPAHLFQPWNERYENTLLDERNLK